MSKRKLTDEEISAFLDGFTISEVRIRNIISQDFIFVSSFLFINIYIMIYIVGHSFFSESMSGSTDIAQLKAEYSRLLIARSVVGLILLCLFNMAFFFTNYFRFIATVGLAYLTNASIDVFTIFGPFMDMETVSPASIFYWLRPLSLVAILACIIRFNPEK
jgi:hypothetical protein